MKILGYKILEGRDKETLSSSIMAHIEAGWVLHGDMNMTTVVLGNNGVTTYAQAIVQPGPG